MIYAYALSVSQPNYHCISSGMPSEVTVFFPFLLSSQDQSTKVKNYIIEILSALVQDGDSLPQEVIDIILSNILEPSKVGKGTTSSRMFKKLRKCT